MKNGAAWLYSVEKLPDKTYLVVASPRPRISIVNIFTDDFLPLILQSGLIALLLSLVVAFFFARWIADPLQKVVAGGACNAVSGDKACRTAGSARGPGIDARI